MYTVHSTQEKSGCGLKCDITLCIILFGALKIQYLYNVLIYFVTESSRSTGSGDAPGNSSPEKQSGKTFIMVISYLFISPICITLSLVQLVVFKHQHGRIQLM